MKKILLLLTFCLGLVSPLRAEIKLPAIFSDHMVLQQKQSNPVWGWDAPGTKVTVTFAGQTKSATAEKDGRWEVKLDPVNANATPQVISIVGTTKRDIQDVLVGEVWMCSGQSNMGFQLNSDWNGDIEAAASDLPNLRLIKVPNVACRSRRRISRVNGRRQTRRERAVSVQWDFFTAVISTTSCTCRWG